MISDLLQLVFRSTKSLYDRFDVRINARNTSRKLLEESYELVEAALIQDREQVAEEASDVIVTAVGICLARGVTLDMLRDAVAKTIAKNDAKTLTNYCVNAQGNIVRKG